MTKIYYVREYTESSSLIVDKTPYASEEEALNALFRHLKAGGVVKGWIEDNSGQTVMLPEDVSERYATWLNSN